MKVYIIDLAGWTLVGIAGALGAYACHLFSARISGDLAHTLLNFFVD